MARFAVVVGWVALPANASFSFIVERVAGAASLIIGQIALLCLKAVPIMIQIGSCKIRLCAVKLTANVIKRRFG
jgi:hypothetical protein